MNVVVGEWNLVCKEGVKRWGNGVVYWSQVNNKQV